MKILASNLDDGESRFMVRHSPRSRRLMVVAPKGPARTWVGADAGCLGPPLVFHLPATNPVGHPATLLPWLVPFPRDLRVRALVCGQNDPSRADIGLIVFELVVAACRPIQPVASHSNHPPPPSGRERALTVVTRGP
jgi:hypothetical protein